MLRLEEVATAENTEVRQQLRHLVLPVTSLALSGHQVGESGNGTKGQDFEHLENNVGDKNLDQELL